MSEHVIPAGFLPPSRYANEVGRFVTNESRILIAGSPTAGFGMLYQDETGTCRREHGKDPVPGPYAVAFGLAGAIDNYGGTGAEIAREDAAGHVIRAEIGDTLVTPDGHRFLIDWHRQGSYVDRHNITLTLVEPDEAPFTVDAEGRRHIVDSLSATRTACLLPLCTDDRIEIGRPTCAVCIDAAGTDDADDERADVELTDAGREPAGELLRFIDHADRALHRKATRVRGRWATSITVNRTRPQAPAGEAYPAGCIVLKTWDAERGEGQSAYFTPDEIRELIDVLGPYVAIAEDAAELVPTD